MQPTGSEPTPGADTGQPTGTYQFSFSWEGPYGRAVRLVQHEREAGVVLDLGCGYGAIAEPLRDAGFTYVGCDLDAEAVADLARRGFASHVVDLTDASGLASRLHDLVSGEVAAITMLDAIEHVARPSELMAEVAELSRGLGDTGSEPPVLVVSIPNVAHLDLAAKLVGGRWDVTPTGLLDRTHVSLFTERRIDEELSSHGWQEHSRDDLLLQASDQHFPPDHPYLAEGGPVHEHLRALRSLADRNGEVNQFVRAYRFLPGTQRPEHEPAAAPVREGEEATGGPFLSVLTRTQGNRPELLADALTCLAAQSREDLEVIVLVHDATPEALESCRAVVSRFHSSFSSRVRLVEVRGGTRGTPLNAGLAEARGRYVAFLDDDDLVTADWAERFFECAERAPGKVARSISYGRHVRRPVAGEEALVGLPVTLTKLRPDFSDRFDPVYHLAVNTTPILSFAVARRLVTELGFAFDERLPVCEDWDFLVRAALVAGVEDSGAITSIYQRWVDEGTTTGAASSEVWAAAHARMLAGLDAAPLLLPAGSARLVATLVGDPGLAKAREEERAALERSLNEARSALSSTQQRLYAETERLRAEVSELEARAHGAERVRDELLNSEFWRASAPIRAAVTKLRGRREP